MVRKFSFFLLFILIKTSGQDASFIYQKTVNSTVTIETNKTLGSGFFVADHIIATCYHVLENASYARCYPANSDFSYEIDAIVAEDELNDLILLKVNDLDAPAINLSEATVLPGERVYVIGSPRGFSATISDGIVSQVRNIEGIQVIQITAPISPGSSGGPVMNAHGDLIGVSFATYTEGQNLNFVIPSIYLIRLLNEIQYFSSFDPYYSGYMNNYDLYLDNYNTGYDDSYSYDSNKRSFKTKSKTPEIIESFNNIVVIDTKGSSTDIGENCYFYYYQDRKVVFIGVGTVINVSSGKCTVEILFSTEYLSTQASINILFEKDLR